MFNPSMIDTNTATDVARQQLEFGPASPRVPGPTAAAHSAAVVVPQDGTLGVRPITAPPLRTSVWTPV